MDDTALREGFRSEKFTKLLLSIVLDAVGMASYTIPGAFEFMDLAWGPISGMITFFMYGGITGAAGGFINAAEEMLPMSDALPTVTLVWVYTYILHGNDAFERYRLKHQFDQPAVKDIEYEDITDDNTHSGGTAP